MLLAIAAVACQNEPEIVPEVNVTSTSTTLPVAGTEDLSFKVTFKTNVDWTVALKEQVQWCTVTPAKGVAGDAAVTVIAEKNETKEPREVTLVITAGTAKEEVKLTQLQVDAFELVKESDTVGAEGGTYDLKVMTNVEYSVVIPEDVDWVTVSKAYAEATTKLVVAPFETLDATRTAELTVKAAGLEDLTFTLVQEGPKTKVWGIDMRTVLDRKGTVAVGALEAGRVLSMALYDGKLVVCPGDGSALVVLNKETGAKEGTLALEGVTPYYVTTDDAGNLIVCNRNLLDLSTYSWNAVFELYYVTPNSTTPVKLINGAKYGPIGVGLDVKGDVTSNAIIAAIYEGIPTFSAANSVEIWTVTDGVAGESVQVTPTGFIGDGASGFEWNVNGTWTVAPDGLAGFALLGTSLAEGGLICAYPENILYMVNADATCTALTNTPFPDSESAGNFLPNKIKVAVINNKPYVAIAMDTAFPQWQITTWITIFDATTMTPVAVCNTSSYAYDMVDGEATYLDGVAASADIIMEEAEGGMNVYYIANNTSAIEAFHYDL